MAAGALGWVRRLSAHPAMGDALAAGEVSESWARRMCEWTDVLPQDVRGDADAVLLAAAASGADLRDLRTGLLPGTVASVSLPLDAGAATETIPAHLRRAVTARDRHCRFPGCTQPPAACQPRHIVPRSQGGPTCPTSLVLLCTFHHLIAVHRWGWEITLHPDGTVTATGPDGRVLHSHGPPTQAA